MKKINVILKGILCGREFPTYPDLRLTETLVVEVHSSVARRGKSVKKKVFSRTPVIEVLIKDTRLLPETIREHLFERGWDIKLRITGDKKNQQTEILSISEHKGSSIKSVDPSFTGLFIVKD